MQVSGFSIPAFAFSSLGDFLLYSRFQLQQQSRLALFQLRVWGCLLVKKMGRPWPPTQGSLANIHPRWEALAHICTRLLRLRLLGYGLWPGVSTPPARLLGLWGLVMPLQWLHIPAGGAWRCRRGAYQSLGKQRGPNLARTSSEETFWAEKGFNLVP